MPDLICQIPTTQLAIYSSLFVATAGFSLFYGLLLGLLAVAAYQNYDEVRKSAFAEAASLANLFRDAARYPEPVRLEVQELLRDYTLYVIYKDWPAHRRGIIYRGGTNRLNMIQYAVLKFQPRTVSDELLHAQTLTDFKDFANARQSRIAGVQTEIPGVLWYAVAIGALINIVLIWMLEMRFFTHIFLGGIVAFFLGVMIFVIASMDNPMRGEISVSPGKYQFVYDAVMPWEEDS
jgi:hypothetical protein